MIFGLAPATIIAAAAPVAEQSFSLDQAAEVVATLHASCERCDWGAASREGAAVTVSVDGEYRTHVMLTRGEREAEYRVLLGRHDRGAHTIAVASDPAGTARGVGAVRVSGIDVATVRDGEPAYEGLAHAPILHARPNTVGRF